MNSYFWCNQYSKSYNPSGLKAPTSVKLEPLFFLKTNRSRFESIDSKTKSEILLKIRGFNLDDLDVIAPDVLEVRIDLSSKTIKYLLNFRFYTRENLTITGLKRQSLVSGVKIY